MTSSSGGNRSVGTDEDATAVVLYVDSDDAVRQSAASHAGSVTVLEAATADEALDRVDEALDSHDGVDCVVAEYALPETDGLALLERLREAGYEGAFLLFTDREPAGVAREAFAAGADDFVQKRPDEEGYDFLWDKIRGAIAADDDLVGEGGEPSDADVLTALLDASGTDVWSAGSVEHVPDGALHDALAEAVASDEAFRRYLARAAGTGERVEPRVWPTEEGDGALEYRSYPLPEDREPARLDVVRDVSAEREREQRIARFERLLDTAQDGLYSLDANGHYTYVNERMADLLGYEREELLGMHAANALAEGEYERGQSVVTDIVADDARESEILELEARRKDGTTFPSAISFAPLYDEEGNYDGLVGILRDISDRKAQERKLRENERRYRAIAENLPSGGVAMFDEDLEYRLVEGTMFEPLEYGPEDFEGRPIGEVHTDEFADQFEPLFEAVFEGERHSFEFNHEGRYYRTQLAPIEDDDGSVISGLSLTVDITEQREYQQKLERQNERLEEFASIVSHDLRNPLNVIEGRLDLYREQGGEDHLDTIEDNVEKMKDLIEDVLEMARHGQQVGDLESVDVDRLVNQCWESVPTEEATLDAESVGRILADPDRLTQLLENLFRNAVEHGGSDVTVTVGPLPEGFYVADDGPGIPAEERGDVFEYGHTTAAEGTGIGLAIVERVATAHDWQIEVTESTAGGARFEFRGVERES